MKTKCGIKEYKLPDYSEIRQQLEKLKEYIDARIIELISDAFGRDGLTETIRAREAWDNLKEAFKNDQN